MMEEPQEEDEEPEEYRSIPDSLIDSLIWACMLLLAVILFWSK